MLQLPLVMIVKSSGVGLVQDQLMRWTADPRDSRRSVHSGTGGLSISLPWRQLRTL